MKLIFAASRKIWDSTIFFLLVGLIVTSTYTKDIKESNTPGGGENFEDRDISNVASRPKNRSHHTTPDIVLIDNRVNNSKVTDSSKVSDILHISPKLTTGNVTKTVVKNIGSTTDESDKEAETRASPKFNFAIIAAIGVLILLTVLCLKCCGWFRAYTRAGDKEDSTQYASIVHTGDEEYGHIDLQSDTASTAYFDTVSSYQSFLKRNGNGSSVTSSRSQKFGFFRQNSGSPRKENGKPGLNDFEFKYMEMKQIRPPVRAETPDTCSPRSESAASENIRTFSVSSEDTDQSNIAVPLPNNDDINNKKTLKSKVSFTTVNSKGVNRLALPRGVNRSNLKQQVSVDHHKRTMSCRSTKSRLSDINDSSLRLQPLNQKIEENKTGTRVDVATQTNRSFIYSRWKSRKRHYSDSGVDDTVGAPSIQELSSVCAYTDNCGHTCASPKKRTPSPIIEHCDINRNKVVNEKTKGLLNRGKSISESESNDEVFATDGTPSPGGKTFSFIPDSKDMCMYSVVSENNNPKCLQNHIPLQVYSSPKCAQHASTENSACTQISDISVMNEITKPGKLDENHRNTCLHKKSISGTNSKFRSLSNCDDYLVHDSDVILDLRKDVHEDTNSAIGVTNSGLSSNTIPVGVYKVKDGISRLKDVSDADHTLIIERESTSSMTSLESSGYAEISSDASTS